MEKEFGKKILIHGARNSSSTFVTELVTKIMNKIIIDIQES